MKSKERGTGSIARPTSLRQDEIVSAQVVLKPGSGRSVGPDVLITSDNIADFVPSAEAVSMTTQRFKEMGFEVGPVVGTSFSLTAPVATFEGRFRTRLQRDEAGAIRTVGPNSSDELPLAHLPDSISEKVQALVFPAPPDFGPVKGGY